MPELMKVKDFVRTVQDLAGGVRIKKRGKNPHYNSKFSNLEDVLTFLNPLFKEHKVLLEQVPVWKLKEGKGEWEFDTTLEIEGDLKTYSLPIYGAEESKMQTHFLAATITYFRRIHLIAIFNLICSDDDAAATLPIQPKDPVNTGVSKKTLDDLKRAFASLNVSVKEIEKRYTKDIDKLSMAEVNDLKLAYDSMKDKKNPKPKIEFFKPDAVEFQMDGGPQ